MQSVTMIVKGGFLDGTYKFDIDDEGMPVDTSTDAAQILALFTHSKAKPGAIVMARSAHSTEMLRKHGFTNRPHKYKLTSDETGDDDRRTMHVEYLGVVTS